MREKANGKYNKSCMINIDYMVDISMTYRRLNSAMII